jgi:hypothetical protein
LCDRHSQRLTFKHSSRRRATVFQCFARSSLGEAMIMFQTCHRSVALLDFSVSCDEKLWCHLKIYLKFTYGLVLALISLVPLHIFPKFHALPSAIGLRMGSKAPVVFPTFGLFPDSFPVVASGVAVYVFLFVVFIILLVRSSYQKST